MLKYILVLVVNQLFLNGGPNMCLAHAHIKNFGDDCNFLFFRLLLALVLEQVVLIVPLKKPLSLCTCGRSCTGLCLITDNYRTYFFLDFLPKNTGCSGSHQKKQSHSPLSSSLIMKLKKSGEYLKISLMKNIKVSLQFVKIWKISLLRGEISKTLRSLFHFSTTLTLQ